MNLITIWEVTHAKADFIRSVLMADWNVRFITIFVMWNWRIFFAHLCKLLLYVFWNVFFLQVLSDIVLMREVYNGFLIALCWMLLHAPSNFPTYSNKNLDEPMSSLKDKGKHVLEFSRKKQLFSNYCRYGFVQKNTVYNTHREKLEHLSISFDEFSSASFIDCKFQFLFTTKIAHSWKFFFNQKKKHRTL